MIGAILTALFFGITPVCAGRSIQLLGVLRANLFRLMVAVVVLGNLAFIFGHGLSGPLWWFFMAGAVGFGIGGMSMFQALPRLGAPLASLIVQSVAAVIASALAWVWLKDAMSDAEIVFCVVVLAGVTVGLLPYIRKAGRRQGAVVGMLWTLLAATGQGFSFTVSRKAILGMRAAGMTPDAFTNAFQRLLGGFMVALIIMLIFYRRKEEDSPALEAGQRRRISDQPWFWVGLNALFGPILGVTCTVWALETMQPGVVQTIAATAPLISVPFARWLQGHLPPGLYYIGAIIAVAGLGGIYLFG